MTALELCFGSPKLSGRSACLDQDSLASAGVSGYGSMREYNSERDAITREAVVLTRESSLLVVLEDTGEKRNGLPVLWYHPRPGQLQATLSRGFSGRFLRVYRLCQEYLSKRGGAAPEPAYLLISRNVGGFARRGFYLEDVEKPDAGYVDLNMNAGLSGRFGAIDQIFPHELCHLLLRQLVGPEPLTNANQVHAIGVRTDRWIAFDEGFAVHMQVMAVDDPDAEADTAALATDRKIHELHEAMVRQYGDELLQGPSSSPGLRETFFRWYPQAEQVLRYSAVKKNLFSREPEVVGELLDRGAMYEAYLVENIVPGRKSDPEKTSGMLSSCEGVVAALLTEWIRRSVAAGITRFPTSLQSAFGSDAEEASPLERQYLKIAHVLYEYKPHDISTLVSAYVDEFGDERDFVNDIVSDITACQGFSKTPSVWLANPDFKVGTSVFDQYLALPRTHTFDLNSASPVDLRTVVGVDGSLAQLIREKGPYSSPHDLVRVRGMTRDLVQRFVRMSSLMDDVRTEVDRVEMDLVENLAKILGSYPGQDTISDAQIS